jgi:hypothetical protein
MWHGQKLILAFELGYSELVASDFVWTRSSFLLFVCLFVSSFLPSFLHFFFPTSLSPQHGTPGYCDLKNK